MRIGLTCTTIEPCLAQGKLDGIGTYTKNLLASFQTKGKTIVPFSFPNNTIKNNSELNNGQFFKYSYSVSTIISLMNPLPFSLYTNLKNKIDILHATDHMLPKINNIPVVATICDAIMFNNANWHWDTIKLGNLKKWMRKKTLHWADHYITISHAMVPELVEFIGIDPKKISVVYLGIDPSWFHLQDELAKQAVLKKLNLPNQFILAAGTIQHKKNLPRLIHAFLELPEDIQEAYPLVIVGKSGWGIEESMAAIKMLTDKKRGVWLDYVEFADLQILFQAASLYAHPSLHEGFGLTVLEAFASNTPVLTSNVKALPEIASNAAYLIDPYSINDITRGLHTILTSPSLQQELVQKGLERARAFSWEKCATDTLKIYESVI